METAFIEIDNIKIAYIEKNHEAKQTIFFIHGNSCSSRLWYKQFDDALFEDYRLIAFDLPAHGSSSRLESNDDYNLLFLGKLMADAVNALAVTKQNILAGFSLGANIVSEMMNHSLPPKGIVLISPTIVGGDYTLSKTLKEGADPTILFSDDPSQEDVNRYVKEILLSPDDNDYSICIEDFNSVKKPFRSTILKTATEGILSDEIMNLTKNAIPLFVVFGKRDKFINCDYLDDAALSLWTNKIYKLDNAGHFLNLDQPKIFNDLLSAYCDTRFK